MKIAMCKGTIIDTGASVKKIASSLHIEELAQHLSYITRWRGAFGSCSVLDHSVSCYALARKETDAVRLFALLHDAAEAVLGDMPSPLKHLPEMAPYRRIEDKIQRAVYLRFVGRQPTAKEASAIKRIDHLVGVAEAKYLGDELFFCALVEAGLKDEDVIEVFLANKTNADAFCSVVKSLSVKLLREES